MLGELRRFELTTQTKEETKELEALLEEKDLSRKELATILFGIRIREGFTREDFGL